MSEHGHKERIEDLQNLNPWGFGTASREWATEVQQILQELQQQNYRLRERIEQLENEA